MKSDSSNYKAPPLLPSGRRRRFKTLPRKAPPAPKAWPALAWDLESLVPVLCSRGGSQCRWERQSDPEVPERRPRTDHPGLSLRLQPSAGRTAGWGAPIPGRGSLPGRQSPRGFLITYPQLARPPRRRIFTFPNRHFQAHSPEGTVPNAEFGHSAFPSLCIPVFPKRLVNGPYLTMVSFS